jgi:hypothetical protein
MKAKLTASNDAIKQELSKDSTGLDDGHYKTFISELPNVSGLAKTISDEVANVSESLQSFVNSPGVGMPHEITINPGVSGYCSFTEDGKIWDIPAGFIFPQCDLFTAWCVMICNLFFRLCVCCGIYLCSAVSMITYTFFLFFRLGNIGSLDFPITRFAITKMRLLPHLSSLSGSSRWVMSISRLKRR